MKNAARSMTLLGVAAILYALAWFTGSALFCADAFGAGAVPCFAQAGTAVLSEPHVVIVGVFGVAAILLGALLTRKS